MRLSEGPATLASSTSRATRVALIVGALLVVAWLALSLRAERLAGRAEGEVSRAAPGGPRSRGVRKGLADFRRARAFNDDTDVLIAEAFSTAVAKDPRRARKLAAEAVDREPENFGAWTLVFSLEQDVNRDRAVRARRRALSLDPRAAYLFDR